MARMAKTVIVGGGAAGLMAAAALAAEGKGSGVLVLETAPTVGKKLLATGNGRCNLYHQGLTAADYLGGEASARAAWIHAILSADQLGFWHRLGLPTVTDEEGRVYPASLQASAVKEMLLSTAQAGGVEIRCGCPVEKISRQKDGMFLLQTGEEAICTRQVILSAGGSAAPALGGLGQGVALAQGLGHSFTPLRPGLVPVRCVNPSKTWKGVRCGCRVTLLREKTAVQSREGEVQFTEYGVSGIVIMQLSSWMRPGQEYVLELDLCPRQTGEELLRFLRQKQKNNPQQRAEYLLLGLVKGQMIETLLRACRIDGKRRLLCSLTEDELMLLAARLKGWQLRTAGTLGWDQAQVTVGGIPLAEVEPETCQSRLVPGLYPVGELLEPAGDCGGFNLAWAFGTALLAARDAAMQIK